MDILQFSHELKEKILVFSQSIKTLDVVEKLVAPKYHYCRIDGSTPTIEREKLIKQFNSPNSKEQVFLLSTRAGGLGINLTAANRVVILDVCWNPSHDIESLYRVSLYFMQLFV